MFTQETINEVTAGVKEILNEHSIPFDAENPDANLYVKVCVNDDAVSFTSEQADIVTYQQNHVIILTFLEDSRDVALREELTAYFEEKARVYGCTVRSSDGLICLCKEA